MPRNDLQTMKPKPKAGNKIREEGPIPKSKDKTKRSEVKRRGCFSS